MLWLPPARVIDSSTNCETDSLRVGNTSTSTTNEGAAAGMPGKWSYDIGVIDAQYEINEKITVGGSYYLVYDNLLQKQGYGTNMLHTLGVNAEAKLGGAKIDAFLLYQTGDNPTNNYGRVGQNVSAYAAQVAGRMKFGSNGSARASFLYASGDDGKSNTVGAFQGISSLGGETTSTYSSARMMMLIDHTRKPLDLFLVLLKWMMSPRQPVRKLLLIAAHCFAKPFQIHPIYPFIPRKPPHSVIRTVERYTYDISSKHPSEICSG